MRDSGTKHRQMARLQGSSVLAVLIVIAACGSNCLYAQDKQGSIDALLSSANSRLRSGETTQTVEAWLTSAMQQSGMSLRFAPPSWDSYAQAKWRDNVLASFDPRQFTNARNKASSSPFTDARGVNPILVSGADVSATTRSVEVDVTSSRLPAFVAPDPGDVSAPDQRKEDQLRTISQLANSKFPRTHIDDVAKEERLHPDTWRVSSSSKP